MNAIDALLALIILLSAVIGSRRGFLVASLQLLTLAWSLVIAFFSYPYVAGGLQSEWPSLDVWAKPLSFVAAFIGCHLILGAITSVLAGTVPRSVHAAGANKALGVAPGLVNGLVNATVVSLIVLTTPLFDGLTASARESEIANRLTTPAEWLEARLAPIFDPAVRRSLQALTVHPESRTTIPLRFKVADPAVRGDLEARMLEMVNAERARQGLKPLQPDPELAQVARAHSRDMLARGYFSHVAPEGKDAFNRMREANVRFLTAGENLALAPTLPAAHQGLMNSPGHRANVLRPQFGRLGVGVLDAGRYGLMVTQNFRN
jgi:uncharacterized protein YkwD